MSQKPQKKKIFTSRRIGKFILWMVFLLLIAGVIALIAVNSYLASNKTKILENLPFLNNGSITFNEANISLFKHFPSATLSLHDVTLQDSMIGHHQTSLLKIDELNAALSIGKLLQDSVEISSIELHHGAINIFTDSTGYNNLKSLLKPKRKKGSRPKGDRSKIDKMQILFDGLDVLLDDIEVRVSDARKTSNIEGHVKKLKTKIRKQGDALSAAILMDIEVKELTFKKRRGTFIADSRVAGEFKVDFQNGNTLIHPFDLQINDEHFLFSGDIQADRISTLTLENTKTNYHTTLPLLPKKLQTKILPFKAEGLFYTKTIIQGTFKNGDEPIVDIQFKLDKNKVKALKFDFDKVKLEARFINRVYTDERKWTNEIKGVRFEIKNLKANHAHFQVDTKNALITSTKAEGLQLHANTHVHGDAAGISDWFQNDQFFFEKGKFNLWANLQGSVKSFNKLLIASDATLDLQDFSVWYQPANVSFPFEELKLQKKAGDASFSIVNSTFAGRPNLLIDGALKNLSSLIFDLSGEQVQSEVHVQASKLSWQDFLDLFGESGYLKKDKPKNNSEKKKSMKETISGIYYNFQPRLSIAVDTLAYYDIIRLDKFSTGLHFEDAHTLVLEKTSFSYDKGVVNFSGKMDISSPNQTPFEVELETKNLDLQQLLPTLNFLNFKLLADIEKHANNVSVHIKHKGILNDKNGLIPNSSSGEITFKNEQEDEINGKIIYVPTPDRSALIMQVELEGSPALFNDFFKTEQFFFSEGRFYAKFDYTGDLNSKKEVFDKATITFSMQDAYIYYKPVDVKFPFKEVDLNLSEDKADFNFFLRSDSLNREINFAGNIENISEMVIGNTDKSLKVQLDISSPLLAWKNFVDIFGANKNPNPQKNKTSETNKIDKMKATVKGMLATFNPNINAKIDTFIYSKHLVLKQLNTGIYLGDSNQLVLDQTDFNFHDGKVRVIGNIDLGKVDQAPFSANFNLKNVDVERLLKGLDYLDLPSLKSIEKLSGQVDMNLDIAGIIADDAKGLITDATRGVLDFDLYNIELSGFPNLDTMATKIRMKKRFRELRFATISNQFTIVGKEVNIPLMEIQSNAINFFVEGRLSYADNTNIWISLPLNNIKRRDLSVVPKKKGYAATKGKVYMEVTSDEQGDNTFKFRLRKRKYYKDRGILKQYRLDKKAWRKQRRKK